VNFHALAGLPDDNPRNDQGGMGRCGLSRAAAENIHGLSGRRSCVSDAERTRRCLIGGLAVVSQGMSAGGHDSGLAIVGKGPIQGINVAGVACVADGELTGIFNRRPGAGRTKVGIWE